MRRAFATVLLPALLLAVLGAAGCGGDREPSTADGAGGELVPLLMPDLSHAEPQVQRQLAEAKAAVDRARESGAPASERSEAWSQLGLTFMVYQYTEEALTALTNAHRLAPGDWRWRYLLGYIHDIEGRQEEAARLYEATLEERPGYVPARTRLGRLRLSFGEIEAAQRQFGKALEAAPGDPAALEGLGRTATARGDHAEAARLFRQALEAAPDASSLHYLLGQALRRGGDLEAAQRELARAGDAGVQIADPLLQQVAGRAESLQFYLVQGGEAAKDERFEQAAGAYQRALEIDPRSFAAHRSLGYVLEKLGDSSGAKRHMRLALESAGSAAEEAEAAAILGNLALRGGDVEEALELYRRSLQLDSEQPGIRLQMADALARLGRMEQALAEYDRLLTDEEGRTPAVRVRRATALVNLGRGEEALAEFHRAVELAPEAVEVRLRYAEALDFLGRNAEAAAQRRQAEVLSSRGDGRLAKLLTEARQAVSRGDLIAAVERYRTALEVAPERHDVRLALAGVLGHQRRWEEAIAEYHRVIEAEPDHLAARRGEIAALILSGNYGPARAQLNEALRRFSRDVGLATTQVRLLAAAPDPRVRDGALALQVARRIQDATPGLPAQDTLAMALAATGEVAEAARVQRDVVEGALAAGAPATDLAALEERLDAYQAGRAWVADEPAELLAFAG